MKPDPDPRVHTVEELAPLMVKFMMAKNVAARARRLAVRNKTSRRKGVGA